MTGTGAKPVTRAEFDEVFRACSNWGVWGPDDERGAANYITAEIVREAAGLIRSGRVVSCSWALDTHAGPDNPKPVLHHMTILQDVHLGDSGDTRFTGDFVGIEFHGEAHSHIDALCHVAYKGRTHNGFPIDQVANSLGASKQTVDVIHEGLVGRGVLIDMPGLRGTTWIEPGEAVMADEIEAALSAQGLDLRQGDIVFFRTGHSRKRMEEGPWDSAESKAGIHPTAMPLFHRAKTAAMGFDGDGEAVPASCEGISHAIHVLGVNAMGLYFLDNLFLEDLVQACEREGRFEFYCVIAPLRLAAGTGSPVNPIAIL
jgi:kynurenine formamidase